MELYITIHVHYMHACIQCAARFIEPIAFNGVGGHSIYQQLIQMEYNHAQLFTFQTKTF